MVRENSNFARLSSDKPSGREHGHYTNKPNKKDRDEGKKALDEYNKKNSKGNGLGNNISFAGLDLSKLPKG